MDERYFDGETICVEIFLIYSPSLVQKIISTNKIFVYTRIFVITDFSTDLFAGIFLFLLVHIKYISSSEYFGSRLLKKKKQVYNFTYILNTN